MLIDLKRIWEITQIIYNIQEKLIRSICDLLSARTIFGGCSFMQYLNKKVESGI